MMKMRQNMNCWSVESRFKGVLNVYMSKLKI